MSGGVGSHIGELDPVRGPGRTLPGADLLRQGAVRACDPELLQFGPWQVTGECHAFPVWGDGWLSVDDRGRAVSDLGQSSTTHRTHSPDVVAARAESVGGEIEPLAVGRRV